MRVFRRDEDVTLGWTKISDFDGAAGGDMSGSSVSLSGDGTMVAIGAPLHDGKGHVRVYSLPSDSCVDACGVLNGDDSTCLDCAGVPNGDTGLYTLTMTVSYADGWGGATIIVGDSNGEITHTVSASSYTTDICDIAYVRPGDVGLYPEDRSFSITLDGTEVFALSGSGTTNKGCYDTQTDVCLWWADSTPTCLNSAHVWTGSQCVTPGKACAADEIWDDASVANGECTGCLAATPIAVDNVCSA